MHPAVQAHNLSKQYRRRFQAVPVFHDLSFSLAKGELLLIEGPNGAGKSTLLRLLAGLSLPTSGELTIHDKRIGLLLEGERTLYWRLTARQNLLFAARLSGFSDAIARQLIDESAPIWGVGDYLDRRYETLSSGQRKRIALLRAFLDPQATLILLDDPCAALDAQGIDICKTLIAQRLASGVSIICSSHVDDPIRTLPHRTLRLGNHA